MNLAKTIACSPLYSSLSDRLCGERCRFLCATESQSTGRSPCDCVSPKVCNSYNCIVEGCLDVDISFIDTFLLFSLSFSSHHLPPLCLLLVGNGLLLTLACTRVGAGALSTNRKSLAMAQSTIASNIDETLDVKTDFRAESTFGLVVLVDCLADK